MSIGEKIINEIHQRAKNPYQFFNEFGELVMDEFSGIRLIGEIERKEGKATYEALKTCLRSIFSPLERFNFNLLETERGHSRAVMSLYLVWTGIFSFGQESGHEFWQHVFEGIGQPYDANISTHCGRIFISSLRENDLETFGNIQEGTYYVTRILLHGLIPERHIEKFIREFILGTLNQPRGFYESPHTIIENWLTREFNVPKPIRRFLQYGEQVTLDLVDRFIEMAKNWDEDTLDTWWQWKLPKYMVEGFRKCIKNSAITERKIYKRPRSGEKPYLIFDNSKENQPIIILPPQIIEADGVIEVSYKDLEDRGKEIKETISLANAVRWSKNDVYSEHQDLKIGPSNLWEIRVAENRLQVEYSFPQGDLGKAIPIFLFRAESGKYFRVRSDKTVCGEVIAIYPRETKLELSGGTFLSEPLALAEKWRCWQYTFCSLEEKGSFYYRGPGVDFIGVIEETLSFSGIDREDYPVITENTPPPNWLRCNDDMPIILSTPGLHLHFSADAFRSWRRAVGRLTRLDAPLEGIQVIPFRVSEATKRENGYALYIPMMERITPGVYQITLRGSIGVEDLVLPFVHLPIADIDRKLSEEKMPIAKQFLITFSQKVEVQPVDNTMVTHDLDNCRFHVSLKEDRADAFCALRVFHHTARPVVLLLERSDVRWVRHGEAGPIEWRHWKSRAEVIPIQRIEEIQDSRALIEINVEHPTLKSKPKFTPMDKLKVVLHGFQSEDGPKKSLMSYEAPRFKRRFRNVWVIDIKQFSDQLKDLQSYNRAEISIDCGQDETDLPLLDLLRYPEYRNFEIRLPKDEKKGDRFRISWEEHHNEPRKNRVLMIYPYGHPERSLLKSIPDGQRPPIDISLEPVMKAEPWVAQIDIVKGRFQMSPASRSLETPRVHWMRMPPSWYDWFEWAELSFQKNNEYLSIIDNSYDNVDLQIMPWSYFLSIFHRCTTGKACQELIRLLGQNIIELALPFTKGTCWEVRSFSRTCLSLEVKSSSIDSSQVGLRSFEGSSPSHWCYLPKEGEFELVMQQGCQNLGEIGTTWKLICAMKGNKPLMISETEGNLEIDWWIADAIGQGGKGFLAARLPLVGLWDKRPYFPLLNMIRLRDALFITESRKGALGNVLSNLQTDKEAEKRAKNLVTRWDEWSQKKEINSLLRRMIRSRLQYNKVDTLTGALALVSRLRAVGLEGSVAKGNSASSTIKELQSLLAETRGFVKSFLPQAFLRDLVLSEIILSWYWNKSLYSA